MIVFYLDNLNEMNYEQTSPLDLSRTGKLFHYPVQSPIPCEFCHVPLPCYSRQVSFEAQFKPPKVVTEPKREWHYRSIKDLAKNHLPYLSGIGPQRTPIRVTVCYLSFFIFSSKAYICLCFRSLQLSIEKCTLPLDFELFLITNLTHQKLLFQLKHMLTLSIFLMIMI